VASKVVIAGLLTALIGSTGVWVTWARQVPTEGEVIELIENRSPYRDDRKELAYRMEEHGEEIRALKKEVGSLGRDMAELKALIKALAKQVESIDKKLDKD
jgi:chromosome segregation ATPase